MSSLMQPQSCNASWVMLCLTVLLMCSGVPARAEGSDQDWARDRGNGPASVAKPTPESEQVAAELGIGRWIWTTNFNDKQICRLWRAFTLPVTNAVRKANLLIAADNVYRCFLDGRAIGLGGHWRNLTDFDLTWMLGSGRHVLAVEAQNDSLEAGVIAGLQIRFADGQTMAIISDSSWYVVPNDVRRWLKKDSPQHGWFPAVEVGVLGQSPWWLRPYSVLSPPPVLPIELRFWQTGWFLGSMLTVCAVALILSLWLGARLAVQTRARDMLEIERARIARDIHDDLGSALTQVVLQGEVAQTDFPENPKARAHLDQLCEKTRAASHSLDEIVWAVNSKRDTLNDFVSYLCKHAQTFLGDTPIRCRLDIDTEMPTAGFDLPVRRGLLLAVKEALNNAAKHSDANELFLRIFREGGFVVVVVEDEGRGFDAAAPRGERNGLQNMKHRLAEMGGECFINSEPGRGCRVELRMPLVHGHGHSWWRRWLAGSFKNPNPPDLQPSL